MFNFFGGTMLFKTKLLAGCVAGLLVSSVALADSSVEFKGYARAGFSLNLSKFGKTTEGAGDYGTVRTAQGEQGLSTRHIRNLNYIQLWVTKNFENNSKFVISLDNETFQRVYENNAFLGSDINFRDAYFQTEITPELAIWAGQRQFIFDDIRVLDILNEYDAFGAGVVIAKNTNVFISKANKSKVSPVSFGNDPRFEKNLQLVAHSKIDLGALTISPEFAVVRSGEIQNENGDKALSGKTAFTGRVLVGFANSNMWNNVGLRFTQSPNYSCDYGVVDAETNEVGYTCNDNKLTEIEFTESGSFEFGSVGLLVGGYVKYQKFKDKEVFLNKKFEPKLKKSRVIASVDVQPVFYATNNFHLALDINKTFKTLYADMPVDENNDGEPDALNQDPSAGLFITPIARYALAKNTIGQAQVYTSVTYGKLDRKQSVWNGKKATDSLVTMQTGFELAF